MESVPLTKENIAGYDVILLSTDHDNFDYQFIYDNANLIVDTRNAFAKFNNGNSRKVIKA